MPIFAYCCDACGHTFEALQKLGAAALTDCPGCGAARLQKQLSAPAFHLKGKGWRKSDDRPKKPDVRPRFVHTLDSGVPHAEHHGPGQSHGGHSHADGHSHNHDQVSRKSGSAVAAKAKGGLGKLVQAHVESASQGHGHSHDHSSGHSHGPGGHTHGPGGHSHGHKAGHKPGKKHKHD
jgi:putative FmdB family regulatory protein